MASESLTLDGLSLTSGGFVMTGLDMTPPSQRADWIGAADSEAQALFRQPLHNNRTVVVKLRVTPQASMDAALDRVGALVDKLRKASATTGGISLVWTPTDSARACTFTVLAGEITGLPIALTDEGYSWVLRQPIVTVTLTCAPYAMGVETLTGTSSSSTPFDAFEVTGVTGDVPALGRLIVTDTASQSRRHVEFGVEGPLTYNASTSLLIDSDDMVTSGFSGTQTIATGAYDPNASGNNVILILPIAGITTAMAGTGNLSHVGVFRVKARLLPTNSSIGHLVRLSWKAGDGPTNHNAWATVSNPAGWQELDLGTITVPAATLGTQRWTGQVEVQGAPGIASALNLDYLVLVPQSDAYGVARGIWSPDAGTLNAYDSFTGTTAGVALGTRTADLGGAWATSGDATDFAFDDVNGEGLQRSVGGSTAGRTALLGTTAYTDMFMQVDTLLGTPTGADAAGMGLFARYVDTSNYFRASISKTASGASTVSTVIRVAASNVVTVISGAIALSSTATYSLRVVVYSSGRSIVQLLTSAGVVLYSSELTHSSLATGGALASGKPGLWDFMSGASTPVRHYDNFTVSVPPAEPVVIYSGKSMQWRYDDTLRQDSTATYYGRTPSYRGSRFLLAPGTSRVLVKARRNDIQTALDDQVTDALQCQVGWTPRFLVIPR